MKRQLATLLLIAFISVLLLEVTLRVAAGFIAQHPATDVARLLPNRKRIVFLGDSHTYGIYLPAEQSYPSQLEQLWQADHSLPPADFINLGYPGTPSSHIVSSLPDVMNRLQPDLLVVLVGINDFWMAPAPVEANASTQEKLTDWLATHSRSFKLFFLLWRQYANAPQITIDPAGHALAYTRESDQSFNRTVSNAQPGTAGRSNGVRIGNQTLAIGETHFASAPHKPMVALRKNLQTIADQTARRQVSVLFITYMNEKPLFVSVNQQYRKLEQTPHTGLVDVADFYQQHCPQAGDCPDYFFPDLHPNAAGYHELAVRVLPALREKLSEPVATH